MMSKAMELREMREPRIAPLGFSLVNESPSRKKESSKAPPFACRKGWATPRQRLKQEPIKFKLKGEPPAPCIPLGLNFYAHRVGINPRVFMPKCWQYLKRRSHQLS